MTSVPLSPGSADVLLFDLGRVVLDIDFGQVMRIWAGHARCEPADLAGRFVVDDSFRRHETGQIDDAAFFENLRKTLGIAISDARFCSDGAFGGSGGAGCTAVLASAGE